MIAAGLLGELKDFHKSYNAQKVQESRWVAAPPSHGLSVSDWLVGLFLDAVGALMLDSHSSFHIFF